MYCVKVQVTIMFLITFINGKDSENAHNLLCFDIRCSEYLYTILFSDDFLILIYLYCIHIISLCFIAYNVFQGGFSFSSILSWGWGRGIGNLVVRDLISGLTCIHCYVSGFFCNLLVRSLVSGLFVSNILLFCNILSETFWSCCYL